MAKESAGKKIKKPENTLVDKHYRDIFRKQVFRLLLTYLAPLVILIIFFQLQYNHLLVKSQSSHLRSTAEHQSNLIDLFLRERIVNLVNLIDNPNFKFPPDSEQMKDYLTNLIQDNEAFIDVGFFDSTGIQTAYYGPVPSLEKKDYSHEPWFIELKEQSKRYIVTDIYLGFRKHPHFTIAVKKIVDGNYWVLRATLDPKKIYDYMISTEKVGDVYIAIINRKGNYQLVSPSIGNVLDSSHFDPPHEEKLGIDKAKTKGKEYTYAYSWLSGNKWAVIVQSAQKPESFSLIGSTSLPIILSVLIVLFVLAFILFRSKKIVESEREKDIVRSQLVHASKLASIGELASGIAHEINNPLATISSEAGLMKDMMDPAFKMETTFDDIKIHLNIIEKAVYRCRDITRKLLSFVRESDYSLSEFDVNDMIRELLEGFYEREFDVSNVKLKMVLAQELPEIISDSNQIQQVILNLVNNAFDAINPPGKITVSTYLENDKIVIAVTDTGKGITVEEMDKIFMPFFTTKEVGKGTGLGLSVSHNIIKQLGGSIDVESVPGKGSTFKVVLPQSV